MAKPTARPTTHAPVATAARAATAANSVGTSGGAETTGATTAEEEVTSSKDTTIGTTTKTDSSQGDMTKIALTNVSKRIATLSRFLQNLE